MNHLQYETSPYLLQHAHNPVDWYAWKPEAFERAKLENKPILVSIGYSTCHWCHVMERESFENESVAAFMNEHFINIKVDREERPDVDQIYMEACQLINGSGCGWPLNCFLTPDARPFYAGTYFPPEQAYNRPSWSDVLKRMAYYYAEKREMLEEQANQLMGIIEGSDNKLLGSTIDGLTPQQVFTPVLLQNVFFSLQKNFDLKDGGFGGAPKFPSTMSLHYLLKYAHLNKNEKALQHVEFSLKRMIQGGIYDQIGGGFSRYTVDKSWLVPHFEKMLYDNALLLTLIADVYKLTKKDIYRETIIESLDFIKREMTSKEGGFYSAQDADSEGVEGKYYVWTKREVETILGENAERFIQFYGVSEAGNWEHHNILWREKDYKTFAVEHQIAVEDLKNELQQSRKKLFQYRNERIHPGLDDKILLDWNALMCSAYVQAYKALGTENYRQTAKRNIDFLLEKFVQADGIALFHTYKDGQAQYDAFLNDYAYLIEALLDVYSITFDTTYLDKAATYISFVLEHFLDNERKMFYFISDKQRDLVARKIDLYDSAVPSGNSTMVGNLQKIGILMDRTDYRKLAAEMLTKIQSSIEQYPTSFGRWAQAFMSEVYGVNEIAVVGKDAFEKSQDIHKNFLPNTILMASEHENDFYPLLKGKPAEEEALIYVCRNYACQRPLATVGEALELI